jgi:hypothetical protein
MTSEERERVKRCVAAFLCGDPSPCQAEILDSMINAMKDDHLVELDRMLRETDEKSDV